MNTSQLTGDDAEELSSCDSGWTKYLSSPTHHDGGDDDDDSEVEFTGGDDDDEHKGYDSEDSDDDSMASDASTGFIASGVDGSKCNDVGDDVDGSGKEGHARCSSSYSYEEFYEVEEARSKQAPQGMYCLDFDLGNERSQHCMTICLIKFSKSEALTRVELDVAYFSEKLLNLEMLLMQVADRTHDIETVNMGYEDISDESVMKAFESDILSGILDMEVNELQNFMSLLQIEIIEARRNFCQGEHMEDCAATVEKKLHDAEESVKKLQDSVADIREQSSKFERTLALFHNVTRSDENEELGNDDHLTSIKKPQTVDQQRHVLQMLEKSLARELDLEKKLSEYRSNEEDLKIKLHYTERELYCMEELMEICLERAFEAENSAELLQGISRELAGKLQLVQLNLNSSLHQEHEMRFKLDENMMQLHAEEAARERLTSSHAKSNDMLSSKEKGLKASVMEAEEKGILASAEILSLREKVMALEEQLRESNIQLQLAKTSAETSQEQQNALQSDLYQMENVMEGLEANVLRAESKAESAEAKYAELSKSNIALNEEIVFLRNSESEKRSLLERRYKDSNTQLEHAKASVEALEEQQNVLYAAITDMQNMIEDLKAKVSKAESRAENAESKCTLLTETNLELNEELGCLRGRLEYLETSLHETEGAKIATARDIGIRTKIISDLVMKLALERERLQLQVCGFSSLLFTVLFNIKS
ncbi:hypothetical protein BHE74_00007295 [Ensete ventricosum]|nr:hypothetical protein BHE74_00007295 [Ensete ventricosum]